MQPVSEVENHVLIYGMSVTYTRWIYHGEPADIDVVENLEPGLAGADNDFVINVGVGDDVHDDDYGVPEVIGELYAAAEADRERPKFAKVLEDAKKALGPGSSHSKFSFLVRMLYAKSHYRISNTGFSTMLGLISDAYPHSELPKSYEDSKKYLRELGLAYENIHVCKNNVCCFGTRIHPSMLT
jgi:hypothetical protein